MLRQAIAAPSRAIRSSLRTASAARPSSLAAPQFRAAPLVAAASRPSQLVFGRRWYSAEAETTDKKAPETPKEKEDAPAETPDAESALHKELEAKKKEIIDLKDRYLRSVADFRNLQDRTKREMKSARDFAIQNFARDLVDSVDNLDRALINVPQEKLDKAASADKAVEASGDLQDLVNLYEGLKMTETILLTTLAKHGLERFDPAGDKFNPNEHEATFMAAQPGKEDNVVFHTQQKGFKLNGRILRPAKVGVVKNS